MIYNKNSESKRIMDEIVDDMYLVCLVDNDFVTGLLKVTGLHNFCYLSI